MIRFARASHSLMAALVVVCLAGVASAQSGGGKRGNQTMSKPVAMKLIAAQELLQAGNLNAAQKELDAVIKRRGLRPLEIANTYNLYAYIASEREDLRTATAYFIKAIEEDALPLAQQYKLEYNVGQLYMMQDDFERALKIFRVWFKKVRRKNSPVTPNGSNYYMLALCYMNLDPPNYARARKPVEIAVDMSEEPQEAWLRMLGQIYYLEQEYDLLAATLEQLIERFNKPEYYTQLSGIYSEIDKELESLAVMQLAHTQGVLATENQIKHLARLYSYHEIPYRAALLLEQGLEDDILEEDFETLRLLADSWIAAREPEQSFAPLEKAADLSENGDLYMRLAQAYVQKQRWEDANEALGRALEHAELKDRGSVHLLRGVARMNLENWQGARASFGAATKFDDQKASAEQYQRYLKARRQQVEALRG